MPSEVAVDARLTVEGALRRATATLAAAGLRAPRREAVQLVADLLGIGPAELVLDRGRVIEPDRRRWIDRAVARRAAGEPLAYVSGLAGFRRLLLRSDRRALIPRPETEGLVDRALAVCPRGTAVDVGTGTGCVALALTQEGGYDVVLGVDCSAEALALADHNRRALGLAIGLARGDLTTALGEESVDLVVANPPYLSEAEYHALEPAVRQYEPGIALVSGSDGLAATSRLLADARRVVRSGGGIVVELAASRATETAALAATLGWQHVRVEADLFGRPRYLVAMRT